MVLQEMMQQETTVILPVGHQLTCSLIQAFSRLLLNNMSTQTSSGNQTKKWKEAWSWVFLKID